MSRSPCTCHPIVRPPFSFVCLRGATGLRRGWESGNPKCRRGVPRVHESVEDLRQLLVVDLAIFAEPLVQVRGLVPPPLPLRRGGSLCGGNPLRCSLVRRSPLSGIPLGGSPLRCSLVRCSLLRGSPLRGSSLRCSPLRCSLLSGSLVRCSLLRVSPLGGISLGGSPLPCSPLGGGPFGGSPLSGSLLRGSPLGDSLLDRVEPDVTNPRTGTESTCQPMFAEIYGSSPRGLVRNKPGISQSRTQRRHLDCQVLRMSEVRGSHATVETNFKALGVFLVKESHYLSIFQTLGFAAGYKRSTRDPNTFVGEGAAFSLEGGRDFDGRARHSFLGRSFAIGS